MKILVKILQGDQCTVDVDENMKIWDVKKQIETKLNVPVNQQALVLLGKTLLDSNTIGFYSNIKDGTKLHLVIRKPQTLEAAMHTFLLKYYTENQAKMITDEFMKDFYLKVQTLSLDDLERLATSYMKEEEENV